MMYFYICCAAVDYIYIFQFKYEIQTAFPP